MSGLLSVKDDLVFGLDIGTRNIVGVVGFMDRDTFRVVAMAQKEHETRAMLDGQIHDIYKVGDTIRKVKNELERQLDLTLSDVCIAAAGRVLRTVNASAENVFDEETRVTPEHIYSLNLLAVEKAHAQINAKTDDVVFYCVGNTPIRYKLNGYEITNLEGHKANTISVELIATFLPEEVVDGLYEAVEYAGLQVASLTLEPIAAMNIAIPERYRLLNIGLVDVGAGTSDICLTKDGSIIAYGMIPFAGDEITEVIAKHYLVDFNQAEKIKLEANSKKKGIVMFNDIMGIMQRVPVEEVRGIADEVIDKMAKSTAEKIIELNGGRSVNAVFVVGGGGKVAGYTEQMAAYLGIPPERVAVRGEEVLTSVDFMVDTFAKDSLYVTPIGICTNYYTQKNNFVFVTVNNERIKMYDNNRLTIVDAVMQIGFPNEKLFPRRGRELTFTINGKTRLVRGSAGEGAVVRLNGRPANLNVSIEQNDVIEVTESTVGEPAHMALGQLEEFNSAIMFIVNDKKVICPRFAYVNGKLKSEFYEIQPGDAIQMENFYTVEQLFAFLDIDITGFDVYVNNEAADRETKVYENFTVRTHAIGEVTSEELWAEAEQAVAEAAQRDAAKKAESAAESGGSGIAGGDKTPEAAQAEGSADEADSAKAAGEAAGGETGADSADGEVKKENTEILVVINGQPVKMTGKPKYVLVDLFEFYDFDLSKPKGAVVLKLNGQTGEYTAPLKDGDVIDLYWEQLNTFKL